MADPDPNASRHGSMQTQPASASTTGSADFNRASAASIAVTDSSSQSSESRRNKTRQIIQEIEKVKARKVPTRRKSRFGLRPGDSRIRPAPPMFRRYAEEQERIPPHIKKDLKEITRVDDPRGPAGFGRQSPVVELLQEDAAREESQKHLVWTQLTKKSIKGIDHIRFYRISSPDGGQSLVVVLKTLDPDPKKVGFFKDYNAEAEFTRRLNMAGCNEVINVIDWCTIGTVEGPLFKICFEHASHRDLGDLMFWYDKNTLILPEAFIWHVFRCIASALAFCNHGTNSGRRIPGWDTIIHGDLKEDNIFLFTPDEMENRLYPFAKLADLGTAITGPPAKYRERWPGTKGYFPPEENVATNYCGKWQYPEPAEPSPESDIWTLGFIIRRMISLINRFVPEHSARELIRGGYKRPFYSPALNRLVEACMQEQPDKRPRPHEVYEMASHFHEIHRRKLYKREEYSRQQKSPVYLGQVLFTDAEKFQFNNDAVFRTQYEEANCGPLRDWLGLPAWRKLDPDHGFKGPRKTDLLISPPASHHTDPQQNTRLVLNDDRRKRWYAEYFEAAGAGLPPPQKPESLPAPDSPTIRVVDANWKNVPKARQQSISEGSDWFGPLQESPPYWTASDYKRGELFPPKPQTNPDASRGVHHDRRDDDDDSDDAGGNGGNVNTASHVGDNNAVGGGGVEGERESDRNEDARSGTAHNNGAAGDAQHGSGRPIQHGEHVHPHQIGGPSQPPQYGGPTYQDQQGGVLHHIPPPQHGPYQGTSLHGGPVPHDQHGRIFAPPPQFGGTGFPGQYGETGHSLLPPSAGFPNPGPSSVYLPEAGPSSTRLPTANPNPSQPESFNDHQPPTHATVPRRAPSRPDPISPDSNPTVLTPDNHAPPTSTTNPRQEKRARFASNVATQVAHGVEVLSKLNGRDGSQWRRDRGLQGRSKPLWKSRSKSRKRARREIDEAVGGEEGGQGGQVEGNTGDKEQGGQGEQEDDNKGKEGGQEEQEEEGHIEMKW